MTNDPPEVATPTGLGELAAGRPADPIAWRGPNHRHTGTPVLPATITLGLAMATASLLLATGCSSTTTGSGVPTGAGPSATATATAPASSTAGSPTGAYSGAPAVTTPLDTTKYQQSPCSALTTAQLPKFGITLPGGVHPTSLGPLCAWNVNQGVLAILYSVNLNPNTTHPGLANVYESSRPGSLHRLPDVDGQPAISAIAPDPKPGLCAVFVGATDTVYYELKALLDPGNPEYANPCAVATRLALAVTATMKAGA